MNNTADASNLYFISSDAPEGFANTADAPTESTGSSAVEPYTGTPMIERDKGTAEPPLLDKGY